MGLIRSLSWTLIIIYLSLHQSNTINWSIEVEPSRSQSSVNTYDNIIAQGTYIRYLGTVSAIKATYTVIIPMDLPTLYDDIKALETKIAKFIADYDKYVNAAKWNEIDDDIKLKSFLRQIVVQAVRETGKQVGQLYKHFNIINETFFNYKPMNSRARRGLLDFIGIGFQWAFGLATDADVKEAEEHSLRVRNANIAVLHSNRQLASLIKIESAEIKVLREHQVELRNTTLQIIEEIKHITTTAQVQHEKILISQVTERLDSFRIQVIATVGKYQLALDRIQTIYTAALNQQASPALVPHNTLKEIIKHLEAVIPSNYQIKLNTNDDEFFQNYQIINTDMVSDDRGNKAITLEIPLINNYDLATLIHITHFEVPFNDKVNTTATIDLPNNLMVAISLNRPKGYTISINNLKTCRKWETHYFCNQIERTPISESHLTCLNELRSTREVKTCKKIINTDSNQNQMFHLKDNLWGFSIRGEAIIQIHCEGKNRKLTRDLKLTGLGKVKIPLDCSILVADKEILGIFTGQKNWELNRPNIVPEITAPYILAQSLLWENPINTYTQWNTTKIGLAQIQLQNQADKMLPETKLFNKTMDFIKELNHIIAKQEADKINWLILGQMEGKDYVILSVMGALLIWQVWVIIWLRSFVKTRAERLLIKLAGNKTKVITAADIFPRTEKVSGTEMNNSGFGRFS